MPGTINSEAGKFGQDEPSPVSGLDYQAFWTTAASRGWLDQALEQAAIWVRERLDLDVDLSKDGEVANDDRSRRVQVLHRQAGRDVGVRLRAWNTNNGTTFNVTVLAVDGPGGGWLLVQASSSDRSRRTGKPQVADRILSVVDFSDISPLRNTAQHTALSQLDELETLINHPDRRFPVIVAAPIDGVDFDQWLRAVSRWTRHSAGIAHVVSLDPQSAAQFSQRHGRRAVQAATLRTYPPGADLSDPAIEQTSRWLTPQALIGNDNRIARTIESFVRQYQVTHTVPLPSAVREWSRAFDRFAAQQLRTAVTPNPTALMERVAARQAALNRPKPQLAIPLEQVVAGANPPPLTPGAPEAADDVVSRLNAQLQASETARLEALNQLAHVQEFLSLANLEDDSLLELLDAATTTQPDSGAISQILSDNDELRNKVNELEDELLIEQVNYSELSVDHGRLEVYFAQLTREAAFLRSKVLQHEPTAAFAWVDDGGPSNPLGACPATWEELVNDSRLAEHGLIFTGSERKVREVAGLDLDGSGLQAAWESLGTMASYRAARLDKSWDSNIHSFCENGPPEAFHVPPNKHAQDETSGTRQDARLAGYRLLPIPKSVSPTGHVHMWAHFKPYSWSSQQKLRIHYYDQVTTDQMIYVGHIGHHLPSRSTDKVHR
ncbi:hypothetical protein ITJ38_12070 [Agreia pratensis]|uniref:hypothetical protein n=1 Tax=Agreia pratensis TaxID=150121 RepID=UPI001889CD79|nr:hypothetical protein [Agreia pratensis]MBF4635143.1 hypothetical protein [Agreia pratensis]